MLTRAQTESLLDLDALRHALRAAMADVSAGRGSMPPRIAAMVTDRGLLAAMPAHLPTGGLAAKLVSLFPGNAGSRLPTHQAVVVVFDPDSGQPTALMDGTSITTLRTAAGSALSDPVVRRGYLGPGVHVVSVGYNTAGREVDSATVADAVVVVESRDAVLAPPPAGSNDLRTPMQEGLIGPEHVEAEIGELLLGTKTGRRSPDQITLYKSVGIAAQDVAAAHLVLDAARERNLGLDVDLTA